jgi:hypothetical protein
MQLSRFNFCELNLQWTGGSFEEFQMTGHSIANFKDRADND